MVEVTFYRDAHDRLAGLRARGHAGFAAHGSDIVCAAVSAILAAARLGLTQVAGADVAARQTHGELQLDWQERDRERESVRAIAATAELAIAQIARRFPKHVCIERVRAGERRGTQVGRVTPNPKRRRKHDV